MEGRAWCAGTSTGHGRAGLGGGQGQAERGQRAHKSLKTPETLSVRADVFLMSAMVARLSRNATDAFASRVRRPTCRIAPKLL
jgi:hypothetical protein